MGGGPTTLPYLFHPPPVPHFSDHSLILHSLRASSRRRATAPSLTRAAGKISDRVAANEILAHIGDVSRPALVVIVMQRLGERSSKGAAN
jgi:hypothetical protein